MCRIFGFRSAIVSQVHKSLTDADNALAVQSSKHPDGWGVAYYVDNFPHIIKSQNTAKVDRLFHHVSGIVSSSTVLAHVRKATCGEKSMLNSHPFQYGQWIFAHNGEIPEFSKVKNLLMEHIKPQLQRFILGQTDSELIFYLFLSILSDRINLHDNKIAVKIVYESLSKAYNLIKKIAFSCGVKKPCVLTCVITNGKIMLAMRDGKELFISTYKKFCKDKLNCKFYSKSCLAQTDNLPLTHFILSSEPLGGENVWHEIKDNHAVAVDNNMILHKFIQ